jgi:hypothetical protein
MRICRKAMRAVDEKRKFPCCGLIERFKRS